MVSIELINEFYKKYNMDSNWIHYFDNLIIPLDPTWKNIAVNVSGGADSALCVCILASIIQKMNYDIKIHFITHVRVWHNRPWAGPISINVYNKLKSMFPTIIGDRIQNFIPPEIEEASAGKNLINGKSGDRIAVSSFNNYCMAIYKIDAVYNAVTLNPQNDILDVSTRPHDRELSLNDEYDKNPVIIGKKNSWVVKPLMFVEKDWVVYQYIKNNWYDLFNITRSCEGDITTDPTKFVDYTKYVYGETIVPECGTCFWCFERNWAIKSALNKLDN